jgi:hypothetical protein
MRNANTDHAPDIACEDAGSMAYRRRFVPALLSMFLVAGRAFGQTHDTAAAQTLFDEGKALMQQGKYAEACPKLAESQRLDPGGGTIFALALCYEGEGKTASAWGAFNDALTEARKDKRAQREAAALEHIHALEGKLTKLRIVVEKDHEGLEVRRDGVVVGKAQWGVAVPVDPGAHVMEARAPKKKPWTSTVEAGQPGEVTEVRVPSLDDEPAPRLVQTETTPARPESSSSQRTWAYVVGGVGLVATGVGAAFGISAISKWNDVEGHCSNGVCKTPAAVNVGDDAGTAAEVSTALFIVGGVGLAAAAVLFFTAPSGAARATRVTPIALRSGGGLGIGGAW